MEREQKLERGSRPAEEGAQSRGTEAGILPGPGRASRCSGPHRARRGLGPGVDAEAGGVARDGAEAASRAQKLEPPQPPLLGSLHPYPANCLALRLARPRLWDPGRCASSGRGAGGWPRLPRPAPQSESRHHGGRGALAPAISQRLVQAPGALERRAWGRGKRPRTQRDCGAALVPTWSRPSRPSPPGACPSWRRGPRPPRAAAPAPQPLAVGAPALPALRRTVPDDNSTGGLRRGVSPAGSRRGSRVEPRAEPGPASQRCASSSGALAPGGPVPTQCLRGRPRNPDGAAVGARDPGTPAAPGRHLLGRSLLGGPLRMALAAARPGDRGERRRQQQERAQRLADGLHSWHSFSNRRPGPGPPPPPSLSYPVSRSRVASSSEEEEEGRRRRCPGRRSGLPRRATPRAVTRTKTVRVATAGEGGRVPGAGSSSWIKTVGRTVMG